MSSIPGWLVMNVYTIILLILLLFFNEINYQKTKQVRAFRNLLVFVLILLIADTLAYCGGESAGSYVLERLGNYVIFAFDPLGSFFTCLYIESWMEDSKNHRNLSHGLLLIYVAVNFVLVTIGELCSLPWFYYYVDNIYHRGEFFLVRGICQMAVCVVIEIYVLMNRDRFYRAYFRFIALLPVIVFFAGVLQIVLVGLQTAYAGTTLACLLLFVSVQSRDISEDYLTGAANRRRLLNSMSSSIQEGRIFSVIMVDVDDFKKINDTWGHGAGDEALIHVVEILRGTFRKSDLIGRYGGDEFCIIADIDNEKNLYEVMNRLRRNVKEYNRTSRHEYTLSLSIGGAVYHYENGESADEFLERVDILLYDEKMAYHSQSRG